MNIASYDFFQAIRGPIMLIALGTLVALDYFQGVSFSRRTWPLLLIVFGIMKLLEKAGKPPDYPTGPYSNPTGGPYPGAPAAYPTVPPTGTTPGANTI
ncbi:MAG: DUF5668 domain-containing protein [Acidobacteriota bacterium]|nr:DUF5668 domain-containing protein [Acidobacteriota bacterium]